jgi:hypothetical protein
VLIKKASVDPAFCQLFLEQRAGAAAEIGLALAPAERAILDTVPEAQLVGMIENTKVPEMQRRAFLGQIGAAMLAALAAGCNPPTDQVTPTARVIEVEKGLRPEEETRYVIDKQSRNAATRQSETTATPTPPPKDAATSPPAVTGIRPDPEDKDTPTPVPVVRGIRPDRP